MGSKSTIDLSFKKDGTSLNPFVFDKNDSSGQSLLSLFKDQGYSLVEKDGVQGIRFPNRMLRYITDPHD
jgi:hypothetical protein